MKNGEFVIVTGMSGAGKTTVLKTLEDMDFFWVDNLPPSLIPKFAQLCHGSGFKMVAVAADDSGESFYQELVKGMECLSSYGFEKKILFLDSPDEILVRRFSEHYRKHPMAPSGRLMDGIRKEREKLRELKGLADQIINTGDMTRFVLRERIINLFYNSGERSYPIMITILSFGYKFGVPLDVDIVFDTRILPNPFYDPKLQPKDGTDEKIQEYVFAGDEGEGLLKRIYDFLEFIIPLYIKKGKPHLTIGMGCTGGRHRSVAVAVKTGQFLKEQNYKIFLNHRDIKKT